MERLKAAANHYNHGRYQVARGEVEAALRNDPANWQAHTLMGAISILLDDPETAVKHFSAALSLSKDPEIPLMLGESLRRSNRCADAVVTLRKYIETRPADPRGYFQLGLAQEGLQAYGEAEQSYRATLDLAPGDVDAANNLGHVLRLLGNADESEAVFRRAISLSPKAMLLRDNLAALLANRPGRLEDAIQCYQENFELEPSTRRSFNIAALMGRAGRPADALAYYEKTLELDPNHAGAYNDIGFLYFSNNMFGEAEFCFRKAAEIDGSRPEFLANLGATMGAVGRVEEAESYLRAAIALKPDDAKPYHHLAKVYLDRKQPDIAMALEREGLAVEPTNLDSLIQLAVLEADAGRQDEALDLYKRAYEVSGNTVIRILSAMLQPPIMGDRQDILASRARIEQSLDALAAEEGGKVGVLDLRLLVETGFYLAFHGMNDRDILSKYSRVLRHACPELNWINPRLAEKPARGKRLRVAFVSKFLFSHSVGVAYNPIIKALAAREDLEISVVSLGGGKVTDPMHLDLINGIAHYLSMPDTDLLAVRDAIAELSFDVIIYADLGMYSFGNFLAHFRLAPAQCCFNGHPDTSGISTVDYRFTWDSPGEVAGAEEHYSEKLVRLKHGGLFLPPPEELGVVLARHAVGLSNKRAYVVPMKLQKLHPDFDGIMARLLEADPEGEIVLFKDDINSSWHELLLQRFKKTIPDVSLRDRIRFSNWLSGPEFRSMLFHADILLDPFHFGAGTTGFLANSLGIPVVTMPMQYFRSRSVGGWYEAFGVMDTVAKTPEEYVSIAIDLARNPEKKRAIGARIRQRLAEVKAEWDGLVVGELGDALVAIGTRPPA